MKKPYLLTALIAALTLLIRPEAHAQFGGLLQKAKDKAAQKASDMMDGKNSSKTETTSSRKKSSVNTVFDFTAGDSLIFAENFSSVPTGSTVKTLKTNGSATVAMVNDQPGKWLMLEASATYRLTKQLFYPKHFTVEFDVLAIADKISDLYPMVFGFTNDNSAKQHISQEGSHVEIEYYNNDDVIVANQHGKYLSTNFDLTPYDNRPMYVSIRVDGEQCAVYLDKTKIVDTDLFAATDTKNLYISAPIQYHDGSKLLIGNLRVAGFKKM